MIETITKMDSKNNTIIIAFEGSEEDIHELCDYVKMINSVKYDTEEEYYRGFAKQDNVIEIDIDDLADHAMLIANCFINDPVNFEKDVEKECDIITDQEEDIVNHPSHYTDGNGMECIDEMLLVFGREAVMHFCLLNCWKYRHRAVYKNGVEDKLKSDWYMAKYKELKEEIAEEKKSISMSDWCTVTSSSY